MILHEPELSRVDGRIRVHSRIESAHPRLAGLGRLWFEVEDACGLGLSDRADPFVVGMLPIAMACGESLEVRGRTSPRLAWGIRELQQVHLAWFPRFVKVVDVRYAALEEPSPKERGAGVATTFSGGVDSFHTLWSHTGEREPIPGFRLSHALMINGFDLDVDLEEAGRFEALRAIYAPLLATLGVELVTVRTNHRELRRAGIGTGRLIRSFNTSLVAPALALCPSLGRLYLAGAHGYAQFETDGSNPTMDPLLGTAGFQTIHDGAGVPTRFAKIAVVAAWPEALATLRVCSNPSWPNVDCERRAIDNCGTCRKCVWALASLELLTGRKQYPGFRRPLTRANLRWLARINPARTSECLREAVARGRRDMALDIRLGIAQRLLPRWLGLARGRREERRTGSVGTAPAPTGEAPAPSR
jgi:hypothetical protein